MTYSWGVGPGGTQGCTQSRSYYIYTDPPWAPGTGHDHIGYQWAGTGCGQSGTYKVRWDNRILSVPYFRAKSTAVPAGFSGSWEAYYVAQ